MPRPLRPVLLWSCLAALVFGLVGSAAADPAGGGNAKGKKLYQSNCLICHGKLGNGQGPAGVALSPPPSDFTSQAFWKGRDAASVKSAIRAGKSGSSMRGFSDLSQQDLDALASYLESFKSG